jgi:hypothetical protein
VFGGPLQVTTTLLAASTAVVPLNFAVVLMASRGTSCPDAATLAAGVVGQRLTLTFVVDGTCDKTVTYTAISNNAAVSKTATFTSASPLATTSTLVMVYVTVGGGSGWLTESYTSAVTIA